MSDVKKFLDTNEFVANSFIGTKKGLVRANRFYVEIIPPGNINFGTEGLTSEVLAWNASMVNCSSLAMGVETRNINTVTRHYYKSRQDSDLNITFLESPDLPIRRFFSRWIRQGYDINTLRRGFPDELKGEVRVYPIGQDGQITAGDIFYEVVPTDIAAMDFSSFNDDVLIRTSVTFKFKWHDMGTENYIKKGAESII